MVGGGRNSIFLLFLVIRDGGVMRWPERPRILFPGSVVVLLGILTHGGPRPGAAHRELGLKNSFLPTFFGRRW
jgi:hypothetical protein